MHSPNPANIDYPALPPIHALRLREDGFVVHDAAVLRLPHATGVVRRHVGPDCDVMFTGHIDAASQPDWIDDTTQAADAAQAWAFRRARTGLSARRTPAGDLRRQAAPPGGIRFRWCPVSRMGWGERVALAATLSALTGYVIGGASLTGLLIAGAAAVFAASILGAIWIGEKK